MKLRQKLLLLLSFEFSIMLYKHNNLASTHRPSDAKQQFRVMRITVSCISLFHCDRSLRITTDDVRLTIRSTVFFRRRQVQSTGNKKRTLGCTHNVIKNLIGITKCILFVLSYLTNQRVIVLITSDIYLLLCIFV